jgi:hypothetical protein
MIFYFYLALNLQDNKKIAMKFEHEIYKLVLNMDEAKFLKKLKD